MIPAPNIQQVAVVGAGLIGSSWATHYLACGLDVTVTDPAPGAEQRTRDYVERAWPVVARLGLAPQASPSRLRFVGSVATAIEGVHFVQENGPERIELKAPLFQEIAALAPADVIIASSSSGLTASALQAGCRHPERCVVGHPFNPPHLIPLVEIVGGRQTSPEAVEATRAFYAHVGKRPIILHKELPGHAANRLQAAIWREAVHLVNEGVLSVSDVDAAVSWGPGLRWGVMGPHLIFHLGGGQGGMDHFLTHLSGPFSRWWNDLGKPELTLELRAALIAGVEAEAAGRSIAELERQRDELLLQLVALRRRAEPLSAP